MIKSKVRCWFVKNWQGKSNPDILYLTYPEDNSGHDLISCLSCGHIYSVSVVKAVYVGPPLPVKLEDMKCIVCGNTLSQSAFAYPDKYLSSDGVVHEFAKPTEMPKDDESVILEFDEIYA